MLTFGPVPSRRLGRSLGINNIPPKTCSYACVYCQVGATTELALQRRAFYPPSDIIAEVASRVAQARAAGEPIDYLSFVPDGEPTLDLHLGELIERLRPFDIPIAVISNASLIDRPDVRHDLMQADWVSLKLDSVREAIWRRINRPHHQIKLADILVGMAAFAAAYKGQLVTETMLVSGVNDGASDLEAVADHAARLRPAKAYISIPTRPPEEPWVKAPDEETLLRAFAIFTARLQAVEMLAGYEGADFTVLGDASNDLLGILAVHPMREDAVLALLEDAGTAPGALDDLVAAGQVRRVSYEGHTFYVKTVQRRGRQR